MTDGVPESPNVFLVDVDETLIDDRRIQSDLRKFIEHACGVDCRDRFLALLESLHQSLGYCDYLGALQRYRIEYPRDSGVLAVSSFLLDYPFADRLFPHALEFLEYLRTWGQAVIVSDGDAVFQPRKIERSGIRTAVESRVIVCVHKEDATADIEEQYPARHYILVDHSARALQALRRGLSAPVSTVLVGHGDRHKERTAFTSYSTPDLTVKNIGDLLNYDFSLLLAPREVEAVR